MAAVFPGAGIAALPGPPTVYTHTTYTIHTTQPTQSSKDEIIHFRINLEFRDLEICPDGTIQMGFLTP
jgi:hypothetical protein